MNSRLISLVGVAQGGGGDSANLGLDWKVKNLTVGAGIGSEL
jgi:hypothetical protein